MKHTPGPWHLHIKDLRASVRAPDGTRITTIHDLHMPGQKANAHLIAAAPAMENALRSARTLILQSDAPYKDEVLAEIHQTLQQSSVDG